MKQVLTWILVGLILGGAASGCAPSVNRVSGRQPSLFNKGSKAHKGYARPVGKSRSRSAFYVRKESVEIEKKNEADPSGSLFDPRSSSSFLFGKDTRPTVGRSLTVKVASNRLPEGGAQSQGENEEGGETQGDGNLQDTLLKALPDFKPAQGESPTPIKRFNMKIRRRYDNGDVLAVYNRTSRNKRDENRMTVKARIPRKALGAGEEITTDDLTGVRFEEVGDEGLVQRESSGWEDEYTLRMSGFDEVRSEKERRLAQKRKRLMDVKERMKTRLESLGKQRRKMAQERKNYQQQAAQNEQKMSQLNEEIKQKDQMIAEQKDQLRELSAADKPGDEKDGVSGQ